jgi:hypothetical protein
MTVDWIERVIAARWSDHRSDPEYSAARPPGLRSPATARQIDQLAVWLGQPLESDYRTLLEFSDGLDNFCDGMPIFGWQDWPSGEHLMKAKNFLKIILDGDIHLDEGIPEGAALAPLSVNQEGTVGIFMVDDPGEFGGRYFWVGKGDAASFVNLSEVFDYAAGIRPWSDFSTQ